MKASLRFIRSALALASLFVLTTISGVAAATFTQQIDPAEVNVGDPAIVTITVQGGSILGVNLPPVDGLEVGGTSLQIKSLDDNGSYSTSVSINISLTPTRSGNFTIPAFDIHTQEGDVLHVKAMKLHVLGNGNAPSSLAVTPSVPAPAPPATTTTNPPPNGPVVMPPANAAAPDNGATADNSGSNVTAPRDAGGGPAKVFMIITPQTNDAYVGQSVPMRIDFYIRADVAAEQNSLPTIQGSDFLMNNFTTRGQLNQGVLENEQYERESWITAISSPKSGDFALCMERDSYWVKSFTNNNFDSFFGGMFGRHANLAHEMIDSNQLTMHIHPLPTEGQPPHFSGAIGQLTVSGEAEPATVEVGEPVKLRFTVRGEGNFDYVRCPTLTDDPNWKTYAPKSGTNYQNEARTNAVKTFEQSVIPKRNGDLHLPAASFSYFDPSTKQYVTVPITLPVVTVTGSPMPIASASSADANDSTTAPATPATVGFLPNRLDLGDPRLSLAPVFRQPWFWAVQGGFVFLPVLGALFLFFHLRSAPDDGSAERAQRQRSLHQEEDAMSEAVRRNDAVAFFLAARHAFQLQLGTQWKLKPEAITLGEIRSRDPQLAETLTPLFAQADEVIYSGQARSDLDLAHWEKCVRTELPQPQPA
jgi:hypothetical protein